jgi:hypothetical protein
MEMERTMQQMIQQLLTRMDANWEERKADRIANRECMKQMMARTDGNWERDQDDLKGVMAKVRAEMDTHHKKMMALSDAHHERTMASLGKTEATDFKAIPEETESVMEHQEILKEDAAVMPVREPRKRRRAQNLGVECRQKRKERTWGNRGPRRKSAAACRKVSRCAKVA